MKWIKAPEELTIHLEKLMQPIQSQRRPMFGYPAYFIDNYLFAGIFQDKLFVRLSPDQLSTLQKASRGLSSLEPMPGRPMKAYTVIPSELHNDPRRMPALLEQAAEWCRSLPPKTPKPKAKARRKPSART